MLLQWKKTDETLIPIGMKKNDNIKNTIYMFLYFCFSMLKWEYELLASFLEYSRLSWDYTLYDCALSQKCLSLCIHTNSVNC